MDLNKYQPTTVADIVIGDPLSRALVDEIAAGKRPIPAFGKAGLLLSGPWGTGKTALAKLLPAAIEQAKSGDNAPYYTYVQCRQGVTGPTLMQNIETQAMLVSMNASGIHYFVLDELDNLTGPAQQSLKSIMNLPRCVFIMTTNYPHKIDRGVSDRSMKIDMNEAPAKAWIPMVRRILEDFGVIDVHDDDLIPIIQACKGSARKIGESAVTLALGLQR